MTKIYLTKYALTAGIEVREAQVGHDGKDAVWRDRFCGTYLTVPEFHLTPEDALAHAEKMRVKRIASLRSQITKLEAMTFSVPDEEKTNG